MGLRVVLIDDEGPARDRLRRMLSEHADIAVVGEASDVAGAVELIDREHPDLCFLDVRMPGGDGFEVLERVNRVPVVVFTTAYDEYAVRAFEVNSADYILKPFAKARLAAALDRARDALARRTAPSGETLIRMLQEIRAGIAQSPAESGVRSGVPSPPLRITARRGAKILLLDPADVFWFEADDTLVYARDAEGRYLVERSLAELEQLLAATFFRVHRGYLVNLSRIGEILPADAGTFRIVMRDPQRSQIPLSRRQAQRLREIIPW